MHLLVFLAENAGEAVSKEQILDNVWPDVFVGEGVVWQSISELRKSLGDDPRAGVDVHRFPLEPLSGPVSWWRADGNALDSAGSNHGRLENGASFLPGRFGKAFQLDGADDFVDLGSDSSLQSGRSSISISAWAKADRAGSGRAQIIGSHWAGSTGIGMGLSPEDRPQFHGLFRRQGGMIQGPNSLRDGLWHHWVGVIDVSEKEIRLYVDGALTVSDSYQPGLLDSLQDPVSAYANYHIGARYSGFTSGPEPPAFRIVDAWQGEIDDLLLYHRVLSPVEVGNLFAAGSCSKQLNLKLDPRASFWYAPAEATQEPPLVLDLESNALVAGDTQKITYRIVDPGYSHFNCGGPFDQPDLSVVLIGVFSSNSTILAQTIQNRVPGAIDAGYDLANLLSSGGNPTDIAFDFRVLNQGLSITIPPLAEYLILGGGRMSQRKAEFQNRGRRLLRRRCY